MPAPPPPPPPPQARRARELFDWLRALPGGHELRRLCDVFTYTAMVSACAEHHELGRALALSEEMAALRVERNVHTFRCAARHRVP